MWLSSTLVTGNYRTLVVNEGKTYCATGRGVEVLDHSGKLLGFYGSPGNAQSLLINGELGYLADGEKGIRVLNLSLPKKIKEIGFYSEPDIDAWDVVAGAKNQLVVAAGTNILLLDVEQPKKVRILARLPVGLVRTMTFNGEFIYAADEKQGLLIIKVKNNKLVLMGRWIGPGTVNQVVTENRYAYVADPAFGIRVLDISRPASPNEIGNIPLLSPANYLLIDRNRLYAAVGWAGITIVDISNPAALKELVTVKLNGEIQALSRTGDSLWVAKGLDGVSLLSIASPDSLHVLADYRPGFEVLDVAYAGEYAAAASGKAGLRLVLLKDPKNPNDLSTPKVIQARGCCDKIVAPETTWTYGSSTISYYAQSVAFLGPTVYLADRDFGVRLYDIREPYRPSEQYSCRSPGRFSDLELGRGLIFTAAGPNGLKIFGITSGGLLQLKGSYDTPAEALSVAVADTLVYVADGKGGLRVIDCADPAKPKEIGTAPAVSYAQAVAVAGTHLFLADRDFGLRIFDAAQPGQLKEIGTIALPPPVLDVKVNTGHAYLANGANGIIIVDIADPTKPKKVMEVATPGEALRLINRGGLLLVADRYSLEIFTDPFKTEE